MVVKHLLRRVDGGGGKVQVQLHGAMEAVSVSIFVVDLFSRYSDLDR